jgi:hypothetical protein
MKFYNQIPVEKVNMVEKIAFLYWYEQMKLKGYKLPPSMDELYEKTRHEVMDFGFSFAEKIGK